MANFVSRFEKWDRRRCRFWILPGKGIFPCNIIDGPQSTSKNKECTYLWILLDTFEELIGSIHSGLWGDSCDIGYRLHQAKITSHCIREARHHTEFWNYKILFIMSRDSNGISCKSRFAVRNGKKSQARNWFGR